MPGRLKLLDGIRGILMINAILYHLLWDLANIFGMRLDWYRGAAGYIWQQCICCGFILLSGICRRLGSSAKGHIKRGLTVFLCGAAVTAVTAAFIPDSIVIFGILTFIGTCMLLLVPFDGVLQKLPALPAAAVSFLMFVIFRGVNDGTLLFGAVKLPAVLYNGMFMTFLGFMQPDFYSADYFALLPWVFLYLTGYFLSPAVKAADKRITGVTIPGADFVGRHSLLFYLAHQPVIYFLLKAVFKG